MSAGWVAVSVRARAMTSRRLGRQGARRLASSPSLDDAVTALARSTYGHDVRSGQALAQAQHAVVDTTVWNLRVLAGWSPREGAAMLRVLVAGLEIANTVDRLRELAGERVPPPYRLGGLATAWPRLQRASGTAEMRDVLATSAWGDPGADSTAAIGLSMRASLADRAMAAIPEAEAWWAGAVALLVARELVPEPRPLPPGCREAALRVIGETAVRAGTLPELRATVPEPARWALSDVAGPEDLWRAEARWWLRVDRDGLAMVRRPQAGRQAVVGAAAALGADAWRVRAALELADRGGTPEEDFDAVA
jgi:hypothetical protein